MGITCPVERERARHVYHLYVIQTGERDDLQAFLQEREIGTLIHYPVPIHLQEAYRELGYRNGDLPLSEEFSRKVLSLPCFPEMTDSEIEEVVETIRRFVERER
jgi:dTDP-4-amino-4,6-dideoxygalactose transaminase